MNVSRDNLDLQRAMQIVCQVSSHETLQVVFLSGEEESLPGYVAYKGAPVAIFKLSSESWPDRSEVADEEEVPEGCVGVFEPMRAERGEKTFCPLEEYVRSFDPNDYETGPDGGLYLKT